MRAVERVRYVLESRALDRAVNIVTTRVARTSSTPFGIPTIELRPTATSEWTPSMDNWPANVFSVFPVPVLGS